MRALTVCLFLIISIGCESRFDKATWLENDNSNHDNPRFGMVEDIRNNYLKLGMTKKEVVDLLGLPQYDTTQSAFEYQYKIGSNPGMHIDPYFLIIDFDSKGQFFNSRIEEH
jgi:outer membrane protein assembly factor BamE (lipoprotein component of BamABCDE complex)